MRPYTERPVRAASEQEIALGHHAHALQFDLHVAAAVPVGVHLDHPPRAVGEVTQFRAAGAGEAAGAEEGNGARGDGFEVYVIRPDGTGLRKVVAGGGRNNHPHFPRDGRWIVFTSRRAGHSAETVSMPDQPQPYGDLFLVRTDGTGLLRLTHNGFEEGTPAWGPAGR